MSTHPVRIGLLGLDTSHAVTFARLLHDPYDQFHIPGAQVVAAYPGGSSDMEISASRVDGFTRELRDGFDVRMLDTPEEVADACDLVFVLAVDGRVHPRLFESVAGRGRPVFVDKPFAVSVGDARKMLSVAAETNTRFFASSAFRYADALIGALASIRASGERVTSCQVRCWLPIEETQGRYFWYGIHAAEMLVACMGTGMCAVESVGGADEDRITVWHRDGRESSIFGSRSDRTFHVRLDTDRRHLEIELGGSLASLPARLLWAALDLLTGGTYPRLWRETPVGSVSGCRPSRQADPTVEETLEIVQLLEAAQRSYATRAKVII